VIDRRAFLTALAALGTLPLGLAGRAQGLARSVPIDVHHHILPPEYVKAIAHRRETRVPDWSPQRSLEEIDAAGIATAMLSLVNPGPWFGDAAEARRLCRIANDYGARLVQDHPGRFGLFASIPLPDADGSLREIEYAYGTLKADGIALVTNYDGRYLGDGAFAPVWRELDRRNAVVYTHPIQGACCRDVKDDVSSSTIEYATDTTRTMASVLFSGTAARYPNIRWIFSHGGGTVPFLLSRFTVAEANMKDKSRLPNGVIAELRKFYYDTAQANHAGALAALMNLVPVSQVVLGTDFPFRRATEEIAGIASYGFSAADVRAIEGGNMLRLLGRA
jgi:predicted TIM-barrel fold metal-dependent hydrolase